MNKILKHFITLGCILSTVPVFSQPVVPVREEPRHKPVLQNKYIRLLDVWMPPGDTSLYHIHETPSLFTWLSNVTLTAQEKGKDWSKLVAVAGETWYRSYHNDIQVHRVCNPDTVLLHVIDIELLSSYNSADTIHSPLPFPLLFENEKSLAWRLAEKDLKGEVIRDRGPMIAELAEGDAVEFYDTKTKQSKKITTGMYLYIEPATSFYFTAGGTGNINLVLFEIK